MAVGFRRLTCYHCNTSAIYRYTVQQIRRRPTILVSEEEEIRQDHLQIWNTVPRYAEVPETIKCKKCGEVLGLYTECIF